MYFGKIKEENRATKEVGLAMLIPMIVLALGCIFFGLFNSFPIGKLIQPILKPELLEGRNFYGFPANMTLVVVTVIVLMAALLNHIFAVKKFGEASKASDHFHHAPGLSWIYNKAENRFFDPYDIGLIFVNIISRISWRLDRAVDWLYEIAVIKPTYAFTHEIRRLYSGNFAKYLIWILAGTVLVVVFLTRSV